MFVGRFCSTHAMHSGNKYTVSSFSLYSIEQLACLLFNKSAYHRKTHDRKLFVCRRMSICNHSLTFAANCSIAMALSCPIFSTSCSFSRLSFSSRERFCGFLKKYNREQWPFFYSGKRSSATSLFLGFT